MKTGERKRNVLGPTEEEFISKSVLLEETGSPRLAGMLILFVLLSIVAFVAWSVVARVDEVAVASGRIIPSGEVFLVQHREGGRITSLSVQEGSRVKQGDALLRFDPSYASSRASETKVRVASLRAKLERIDAIVESRKCDFRAAGVDDSTQIREQLRYHEEYLRSLALEKQVITSQMEQLSGNLSELATRRKTVQAQRELLVEEMGVREKLVSEGLNSKLQYLNLKRQLSDIDGTLAAIPSQMSRIEASIAESKARLAQLLSLRGKELLAEREQVNSELMQMTEASRRDARSVEDLELRAPIAGIVAGMKVHAAGEVLMPGSTIMQIVPEGKSLVADIQITPRDIGHVRTGQKCLVKFSAFDYSRYGGVEGIVQGISANSFSNPDGSLFYRGTVALSKGHLGNRQGMNSILPGMSVQAEIRTGGKTIFEYLLKPVFASTGEALRER